MFVLCDKIARMFYPHEIYDSDDNLVWVYCHDRDCRKDTDFKLVLQVNNIDNDFIECLLTFLTRNNWVISCKFMVHENVLLIMYVDADSDLNLLLSSLIIDCFPIDAFTVFVPHNATSTNLYVCWFICS